MKTKILYVLVSDDKDIYWEQTLLSVSSLHLHVKDAESVLLVDDRTHASFTGNRQKILKYFSREIIINIDGVFTKRQRSRFLKTSMRKYINGDFLFLDSDTIVREDLSDADRWEFDIGAVPDTHAKRLEDNPNLDYLVRNLRLSGYKIERSKLHYNSGVLLVKDNARTRKFFEEWHHFWLMGIKKGIDFDQSAFSETNICNNYLVHELSGIWNCQVRYGFKYLAFSKILHFYGSQIYPGKNDTMSSFTDYEMYLEIKKTGHINEELLRAPFDCFSNKIVAVYDKDIFICCSHIFWAIHILYGKYNILFRIMENACCASFCIYDFLKNIFKK
jgi:lipopolysaccharide biosynthesis glycosyltransferase